MSICTFLVSNAIDGKTANYEWFRCAFPFLTQSVLQRCLQNVSAASWKIVLWTSLLMTFTFLLSLISSAWQSTRMSSDSCGAPSTLCMGDDGEDGKSYFPRKKILFQIMSMSSSNLASASSVVILVVLRLIFFSTFVMADRHITDQSRKPILGIVGWIGVVLHVTVAKFALESLVVVAFSSYNPKNWR